MRSASADEATLAWDLDLAVRSLTRLMRHEVDYSLSITAGSVLSRLSDGGPRRISELAAIEQVAQPTMTTLIGRLEGRELVTRAPAPDDGRAVLVELTKAGEEFLARVRERRAEVLAQRIDALGFEGRDAIHAALPHLHALGSPETR